MMNYKKHVTVCAFKYNGWLYRTVAKPLVLFSNKDVVCLYLAPKKVKSLKNEENSEKCICYLNAHSIVWFFFNDQWFNVMVSSKSPGVINYYVNLASPFILEKNVIKYIDFDLDFKIGSDNEFKILDKTEHLCNIKRWRYPPSVKVKITKTQQQIIHLIKNNFFNNLMNEQKLKKLKQCLHYYYTKPELYKFSWKHIKP